MKTKKPETEVVKFRIEKALMDEIRHIAIEEDRDYTQQINRMLRKAVKKR